MRQTHPAAPCLMLLHGAGMSVFAQATAACPDKPVRMFACMNASTPRRAALANEIGARID
jgi:hypothetical protein